MSSLPDFVLARIAEDEAVAQHVAAIWAQLPHQPRGITVVGREVYYLERVLAECEAKRRIVDIHYDSPVDDDEYGRIHLCGACSPEAWPCATLRALASVYADHEDYREEWRA